MGFCLFNNVAIAAATARAEGAARVAVLDWDVHHGNGTQNAFYDDPNALYLSCHQWPYYPGTGAAEETGTGPGVGATINVGLPPGCDDADYQAVMDEVFAPALRRFAPDVILVSAGFDAHEADPLAEMRVTAAGYHAMAARLRRVAEQVCEGRLVYALEGGYDLGGLSGGLVAVLDTLWDEADARAGDGAGDGGEGAQAAIGEGARRAIDRTRRAVDQARQARQAQQAQQAQQARGAQEEAS
jgi:acetoin utilization deacetylase AcuC-like enzyme